MKRIAFLGLALCTLGTTARADIVIGGVSLTPAQYAQVQRNFTFLRHCPVVPDIYAVNAKGGNDCTGGQSGSPSQGGGDGGGGGGGN